MARPRTPPVTGAASPERAAGSLSPVAPAYSGLGPRGVPGGNIHSGSAAAWRKTAQVGHRLRIYLASTPALNSLGPASATGGSAYCLATPGD
jgi:hypothetical protein